MKPLKDFYKPIKIPGIPSDARYSAYVMDSTEESDRKDDIRHVADLGTCNSCDYFLPGHDIITIIEVTDLSETEAHYKEKYKYLLKRHEDKMKKLVEEAIQNEMRLKAYGTLLTICRISGKPEYARAGKIIQQKRYKFWIVDSSLMPSNRGMPGSKGMVKRRIMGKQVSVDKNWRVIKRAIAGILGRKLVYEVDIISPQNMRDRFPKNVPTL